MRYIWFILALNIACFSVSQVDNSGLFINQQADTIDENTPYLKLQGLGFMKDIENFGPLMDGYTLFGMQFNPQLGYQVSKNLSFEGGVYLRKDYGHKGINDVLPTFSIRYHKKDFKMIFGNLDGSLNHQLIEPIYAFERVVTNRLENGAQFIVNKKKYDIDLWIDWQNMLYRLVNDYEHIWAGFTANVFKISTDKFEFKVPLQAVARHNGGQIARGGNINRDPQGVYTNFNVSPGLYFKYKLPGKTFKNIYLDLRYVLNQNNSRDSISSQSSDGFMVNVGANIFNTDVMISYWLGRNYNSEFGGDLYQNLSSSITYAGTYITYRHLIITRFTKKITLADQVILTLRAEPQFDLDFNRFNADFGFYINFNKRISFKGK